MANELRPAAWANQLISVWRSGMGTDKYPISVPKLIDGFINLRFQDAPITIESCALDSIEGFLVRNPQGWTIGYNQSIDHAGRTNFTLAHELGHYLCHRQLQDKFNCGPSEMMDTLGVNIEQEANEFAAHLLMPYDDYRNEVEGKKVTVEIISDCAQRYGTSWTAAVLHWLRFTTQKAIFVHSRDGYALWAKSSKPALKAGLFIKAGHELPEQSLTIKCEKNGNDEEARSGMLQPAKVWHPELEVWESAMHSKRFKDWSYTILLYR